MEDAVVPNLPAIIQVEESISWILKNQVRAKG
jgi:hypothetical protein